MTQPVSPARSGRFRRYVWLTIFTLAAFTILVSLGVWQLRRLEWKREVLANVERARAGPERPLTELLAAGEDLAWRRARVACEGSGDLPAFARYGLNEGQIAWRALSGCKLPGQDIVVWLDRGIIDVAVGSPREPANMLPPPQAAQGVLRSDFDFGSFPAGCDEVMSGICQVSAQRVLPVLLAVEREAPAALGLTPSPLPTQISNRHLEYALTWFGLAGALVAVYASVLIQDRRRAGAGPMSA